MNQPWSYMYSPSWSPLPPSSPPNSSVGEGEGGMFWKNSMYIIYSETDHQPRWDAWDKCSGLVHWEDPEEQVPFFLQRTQEEWIRKCWSLRRTPAGLGCGCIWTSSVSSQSFSALPSPAEPAFSFPLLVNMSNSVSTSWFSAPWEHVFPLPLALHTGPDTDETVIIIWGWKEGM